MTLGSWHEPQLQILVQVFFFFIFLKNEIFCDQKIGLLSHCNIVVQKCVNLVISLFNCLKYGPKCSPCIYLTVSKVWCTKCIRFHRYKWRYGQTYIEIPTMIIQNLKLMRCKVNQTYSLRGIIFSSGITSRFWYIKNKMIEMYNKRFQTLILSWVLFQTETLSLQIFTFTCDDSK